MSAHVLYQLSRRTAEPPVSWLMATALARPRLISLAPAFRENQSLPVAEVRRVLNRGACLAYGFKDNFGLIE